MQLAMRTLLLLVTVAQGLRPETWSRFRGANGTGIVTEDYVIEFGDKKNLLWKRPIPPGKSSPVLTESRIFLTAEEGEKLVVLCLDRKTGKTGRKERLRLLWQLRTRLLRCKGQGTVATAFRAVLQPLGHGCIPCFDGRVRYHAPRWLR